MNRRQIVTSLAASALPIPAFAAQPPRPLDQLRREIGAYLAGLYAGPVRPFMESTAALRTALAALDADRERQA